MMKWIVIIIVGIGLAAFIPRFQKIYTVRVTFCDNRKPITLNVYDYSPPDSHDIRNAGYYQPLSSWNGYLNVCCIETIREMEIDNH